MQDPELFSGLATFLDNDLDTTERDQIFVNTIPRMVERAKALRSCKPPQGLHFSLQQQGNSRLIQNVETIRDKENEILFCSCSCFRGLRRVQLRLHLVSNRERVLLHVSKKNREDASDSAGLQFHKFLQASSQVRTELLHETSSE